MSLAGVWLRQKAPAQGQELTVHCQREPGLHAPSAHSPPESQGGSPVLLHRQWVCVTAAAAAKSIQSCPTLCDPIDGNPSGSTVPGILQARTLEWVAISFSNAWKWKWSCSVVSDLATPWTAAYQAPLSMGFPGKSTGVGCHCLLRVSTIQQRKSVIIIDYSFPLEPPSPPHNPPMYHLSRSSQSTRLGSLCSLVTSP